MPEVNDETPIEALLEGTGALLSLLAANPRSLGIESQEARPADSPASGQIRNARSGAQTGQAPNSLLVSGARPLGTELRVINDNYWGYHIYRFITFPAVI